MPSMNLQGQWYVDHNHHPVIKMASIVKERHR